MRRFVMMAAMVTALALLSAPHAQAAIFEPQNDWWNSGRTCVDSRAPPGLAWDDPAPRACVARPEPAPGKLRADALGEDGDYTLARAEKARPDKFAYKDLIVA